MQLLQYSFRRTSLHYYALLKPTLLNPLNFVDYGGLYAAVLFEITNFNLDNGNKLFQTRLVRLANYSGFEVIMSQLDTRANDFGLIVRDILKQFTQLHEAAACGPQANLGHQDLRVVEHLGESGPQMMRCLAEHLGVAVNSMTNLVDNLEQKGLAHRTRSEIDRRVIHVDLTEEGKKAFIAASNAKFLFHRALLSALTEDEQQILLVLFRKIAREGWKQVEMFSSSPSNHARASS